MLFRDLCRRLFLAPILMLNLSRQIGGDDVLLWFMLISLWKIFQSTRLGAWPQLYRMISAPHSFASDHLQSHAMIDFRLECLRATQTDLLNVSLNYMLSSCNRKISMSGRRQAFFGYIIRPQLPQLWAWQLYRLSAVSETFLMISNVWWQNWYLLLSWTSLLRQAFTIIR